MGIKYIIWLLLLPLFLVADIPNSTIILQKNVLKDSKALVADNIFDINSTTSRSNFKRYPDNTFSLFDANKNLWVKLDLDTKGLSNPILVVDVPLLTKLKIYNQEGNLIKDLSYTKESEKTLIPYFNLEPNSKLQLYIQMQSRFIPQIGTINLTQKKSFLTGDAKLKFFNSLLIGVLLLVIVLLLIYFNLNQKKETLYLVALITLTIYYFFTYSGLAKVVTSSSFAQLDIAISSGKLNFITIALSLYSISLLKLSKDSIYYRAYKGFMAIAILELFATGFMNLPLLYALLPLVGVLLFSIVLLFIAIRQKEFDYIYPFAGYMLLFITFVSQTLIALGAKGIIAIQKGSLLLATIALLLNVWYYLSSYIKKELSSSKTLIDGLDKKYLLEGMLKEKQEELDALNSAKEILKQDIHAIIDNNFKQILRSLDANGSSIDHAKLTRQISNVEQRMQAISLCYTHMLQSNDLKTIDMAKVIDEILNQIKSLYTHKECNIEFITNIDATLPINDAVVAATTISEMVMDTFKSSCQTKEGLVVVVDLKNTKESYSLSVKDYPKGHRLQSEANTILQKFKQKLQQLRNKS